MRSQQIWWSQGGWRHWFFFLQEWSNTLAYFYCFIETKSWEHWWVIYSIISVTLTYLNVVMFVSGLWRGQQKKNVEKMYTSIAAEQLNEFGTVINSVNKASDSVNWPRNPRSTFLAWITSRILMMVTFWLMDHWQGAQRRVVIQRLMKLNHQTLRYIFFFCSSILTYLV